MNMIKDHRGYSLNKKSLMNRRYCSLTLQIFRDIIRLTFASRRDFSDVVVLYGSSAPWMVLWYFQSSRLQNDG
jgi:hypothetical protein